MPYGLVDEASEAAGTSEAAPEVPEAAAEAAAEVAEAAAAEAEAGFTLASGLEGAAADSAIMVSFSFPNNHAMSMYNWVQPATKIFPTPRGWIEPPLVNQLLLWQL